ncbi:hypothetical protein ACFFRR_010400 [Megaselia abdita]
MFILISGGMQMIESSVVYPKPQLVQRAGWFAGVIIGSFLGAIGNYFTSKKILFLSGSIFIIIGGILDVLPEDLRQPSASNWIDGAGYGIAIIAIIIMGGDNSSCRKRGRILSVEALGSSAGILILCIIWAVYYGLDVGVIGTDGEPSFTVTQLDGVISIVLGIAGASSAFLCVESPVKCLMDGDECDAACSVQALHHDHVAVLQEHKDYVDEDKKRSLCENILQGIMSFVKLVIVRTFLSLTISFPIVITYLFAEVSGYHVKFGLLFFGLTRLVGAFIGQYLLIDRLGRKWTLAGCSLVIGAFYIAIGSLLEWPMEVHLVEIASLILVANLFCGMCMNVPTTYLSEAFSPSVKPMFLFAITLVENCAIIVVYSIDEKYSVYYYVVGGFMLLICAMAIFALPETKGLTLRKSREEFLKGRKTL